MANLPPQLAAALVNGPGLAPVQYVTEEQKKEIALVRGMQVRTQAATLACQLLAGRSTEVREWAVLAKVIEEYISGEAT